MGGFGHFKMLNSLEVQIGNNKHSLINPLQLAREAKAKIPLSLCMLFFCVQERMITVAVNVIDISIFFIVEKKQKKLIIFVN